MKRIAAILIISLIMANCHYARVIHGHQEYVRVGEVKRWLASQSEVLNEISTIGIRERLEKNKMAKSLHEKAMREVNKKKEGENE